MYLIVRKLPKEVEISVADTGIGITKDQQERIFTKFFRGDNATRMETEGSGLGLFIAKNIVEEQGGHMWFVSEPGKGSIFYITIPIPTVKEGVKISELEMPPDGANPKALDPQAKHADGDLSRRPTDEIPPAKPKA